jgi:hypothetical protein
MFWVIKYLQRCNCPTWNVGNTSGDEAFLCAGTEDWKESYAKNKFPGKFLNLIQ